MLKPDEISNPESCLNRARETELVFVLLGRDICASHAIRHWCIRRVQFGKNSWLDPQIQEAMKIANAMEAQHYNDTSKS